jgi:hypothetical protein
MPINQSLKKTRINTIKSDLMPIIGENGEKLEHISLKRCDIRGENEQKIINNMKNNPAILKRCDSQENLFIRYFIKGQSPKKAALSAGYKESTATLASAWLNSNPASNKKLHVFYNCYLQLLQIDERAAVQATDVLTRKKIDAHFVELKIIEQLDKANADIPAHYKITKDKETGEEVKTPIYKYNQPAALKALELLGKHKHIKAFDNEIEHKVSDLGALLTNLKTSFRPPRLTGPQTIKTQHIDGEAVRIVDNKPDYYPPATIPAALDIPKRKPGRPPKAAKLPDDKPKRPRGRPKKGDAM